MQRPISYMQLRGGSSKGLYFNSADLPSGKEAMHNIILAAMEGVGKGDPRQIDGLGGANSLTSKVAVVSLSDADDADLNYYFLQVVIGKGQVSDTQTCGNILAGVLPFAIESGIWKAHHPKTSARVKMVNTGGICEVTIETPNGQVEYAGNAKVDGVPGTAAAIICSYIGTEGSTCGSLLPTGNKIDILDGIHVTCIDNGMPEVLLHANDLGISGYETPEELNAHETLKSKLEKIRLLAGPLMNLGDVKNKTIPKLCMLAAPIHGGAIHTRTFIPHTCHEAIGVLGAVSAATACKLNGTIANTLAVLPENIDDGISIEHPSGEFTVKVALSESDGHIQIQKTGVIRTARLISKGYVYIPGEVF
jgi:4-oxalomesaconate tautomerase